MNLDRDAIRAVTDAAHPLVGAPGDFTPIINAVGDARFVLIGEASHGTHEFYRIRAEITKRLIREKDFSAVAVEADWPDAYRVNRFVRGQGDDTDAVEALGGFRRFPQWMWRNADVLDFIGWLRAHNETHRVQSRQVGFYGLDLYSLHASMDSLIGYLREMDPEAAIRAQQRYACFDLFGGDPQEYGYAATIGTSSTCEDAVVRQLLEIRAAAAGYARRDGRFEPDALFAAEQNARLIVRAEQYYRAMFLDSTASWNIRDTHMAESLGALAGHLAARGASGKVVVWAHNSHLGDAGATDPGRRGQVNLGQLTREEFGRAAILVGFSTYAGSVTAASDWDAPAERKRVRDALDDSYEALFHLAAPHNFLLDLSTPSPAVAVLRRQRLQRAIGVIYRPATERLSHYYSVELPRQFDLMLHYDLTRAVEPLERTPMWERGERGVHELPETYPSAL